MVGPGKEQEMSPLTMTKSGQRAGTAATWQESCGSKAGVQMGMSQRAASWHEGPGAGDKEEPAVGLWLGIREGWHPRGLLGVPVVFENCEGAGDGRSAQCAGPCKQTDRREENSVFHQISLTRNS